MGKPSIFIGSSTEGLDVARAVGYQLQDDAEVTIWSEGFFEPTHGTLETLVTSLSKFAFAILVLTPDDLVFSRELSAHCPRDNIIFELGLFMGHLGRSRTLIVCDSQLLVKLPSDLAGISIVRYAGNREDGNLIAAVSPACTLIRKAISNLGLRSDIKFNDQPYNLNHSASTADTSSSNVTLASRANARAWFYYCYISEAKVDQILSQAHSDTRESIDEAAEAFTRSSGTLSSFIKDLFEAGGEFGKPNTLRPAAIRGKILANKLYAALNALERKLDRMPSLTEAVARLGAIGPGIFSYYGEFRVSKYDEKFAYLESTLTTDVTIKLSCSLRYFSDMWDEDSNFVPHSGNAMFFSGEASPQFQSIIYVLQVKPGLILATPLFLGLPLDSPLQL